MKSPTQSRSNARDPYKEIKIQEFSDDYDRRRGGERRRENENGKERIRLL